MSGMMGLPAVNPAALPPPQGLAALPPQVLAAAGIAGAPPQGGGIVSAPPPQAAPPPAAPPPAPPVAAALPHDVPAAPAATPPPAAPTGNPFLDAVRGAGSFVKDIVGFPGAVAGSVENGLQYGAVRREIERQTAIAGFLQMQRTYATINAMPEGAEKTAALLNAQELGRALATNFEGATLSEGQSRLNGATGQFTTAPKMNFDDKSGVFSTQTPNGVTPTGQLGGDYSIGPTGAEESSRTGLTGKTVSLPQKLAPAETPAAFTPTVSGFSGPPGPLPQVGQPTTTTSAGGPVPGAPRNNPGNLRPRSRGAWAGQTGVDGGFAVFGSPQAGAAAAEQNLIAKQRIHGLTTLNAIIGDPRWGWAPAADHNDPATYAARVAQVAGVKPDQPIDLVNNRVLRQKVLQGIFQVEGGGGKVGASAGAAQASAAPGWSLGSPAGAGYRLVSGKDIQGGDPNLTYKIAPNNDITPIDRAVTAQDIHQTGQTFMGSDDYKSTSTAVSAVNGLVRAMKSVNAGTPLAMGTMDSLMRGINPGASVRAGTLAIFMGELGAPAHLQAELGKFKSGDFIPPQVARQALGVAYAYAESHMNTLTQRHQANISYAQGAGYSPDLLGESLPSLSPFPVTNPSDIPVAQRVAGRAYETPKGIFVWGGKGWQRAQ